LPLESALCAAAVAIRFGDTEEKFPTIVAGAAMIYGCGLAAPESAPENPANVKPLFAVAETDTELPAL
jgi:hypothetical protein